MSFYYSKNSFAWLYGTYKKAFRETYVNNVPSFFPYQSLNAFEFIDRLVTHPSDYYELRDVIRKLNLRWDIFNRNVYFRKDNKTYILLRVEDSVSLLLKIKSVVCIPKFVLEHRNHFKEEYYLSQTSEIDLSNFNFIRQLEETNQTINEIKAEYMNGESVTVKFNFRGKTELI